MNPITLLMTAAANRGDIQKAIALWESVKKPNTELIDLLRKLGGEFGLLDQAAGVPAPVWLGKYDFAYVQRWLNKNTGTDLVTDGNLGEATRDAVKAFQSKHNLKADEIPGLLTIVKMVEIDPM